MTALMPRSTIGSSTGQDERIGEAELAAAAFLARYQGRTLDPYRYDLRAFLQWAADEGLVVLSATRPQLELYVRAMEGRGLAATTIDRRLSTVCGFNVHPHMLRAAFIMCALEAGVPLREVQLAARHADPRTTTVYDHRRQSFDRPRRTSLWPSWQADDLPAR